jgi:hypothetical protein
MPVKPAVSLPLFGLTPSPPSSQRTMALAEFAKAQQT